MGLGSALSTAVSGLSVNQNSLDIIGNNLANSNTTAFKSFRNEFVNSFYSTLSLGSTPASGVGGTNPRQVGQGANIGSVTTDFRPGSPTQTGLRSDLFIQGNGFFAIKRDTEVLYTRDGSFRLNSNSELVNAQGLNVLGFGVDANFKIQTGSLINLSVPLGSLQVAQATRTAFIQGILRPDGALATQPTIVQTQPILTTGAVPATASSTLNTLTIGGNPVIPGGFPTTLSFTPTKGGRQQPPAQITLTGSETLQQLGDFLSQTLGINTQAGLQSTTAGASVLPSGALQLAGNLGTLSDFNIDAGSLRLSTGGSVNFPTTKTQTADGESVLTQFVAYDSLGSAVTVTATAYLQSLGAGNSVFRMLFDSPDQRTAGSNQRSAGEATLTFDQNGQLTNALGNTIVVDRENTGAATPLSFTLDVSGISALAVESGSSLAVVSQDGSPPGTLIDYGIGADGVVVGAFDNGITRNLGQVALARFSNPAGLVAQENNLYRQGPNSGLPFVTQPGANGVGSILSSALELSNVDVAVSFVQLLTASTAFSANSRVIATTQELFQTLLNLPRT